MSGELTRLSGITRYDTMSRIVDTAFPDTASTVVIASGENYPDALAASGFAGVKDSPILMTDPLYLSNQTKSLDCTFEARKDYHRRRSERGIRECGTIIA